MMSLFESVGKKTFLGFAAAVLMLFTPGAAFAEEVAGAPSTDTTTQTATTDPTATQTPAQPAPNLTFHYNPETGMWENDHYIWDPATGQTTPKESLPYTYNNTTGKWETDQWKYDPVSQTYTKAPPPAPVSTPTSDPSAPAATTDINSNSNLGVNNGLVSSAITGDATVALNGIGGNATSGDATILSNTLNLLQSGVNLGGLSGFGTVFVADVNRDLNKDLV